MVIDELKTELLKNGINMSVCLIDPKVCPEGALCIKKVDGDFWTVSLNERGEFIVREKFNSEDEACRFFFLKAISDPTYRKDFKQTDLLTFNEKKKALLKKYGYLKE